MSSPIPILLYHAVRADPSGWIAPFTVPPAVFARQVALIADCGRTPLTVSGLRDALAAGRPPDRPVVVTFDDGFADTADTAAPLLADVGIAATIYLTTGFLGTTSPGGDPMLSWAAASDLAAAGHEIGAHSISHPHLDILPQAEAREEIVASRARLQDGLGLAVRTFAYPHGYSSPAVRRLVLVAGYDSACAVKNAHSHPADPSYTLARLTVTARTSDDTFRSWLTGTGVAVARPRDGVTTRAWRIYRRARRIRGGRS